MRLKAKSNLDYFFTELGLSNGLVAEKVGVSRQHVYNILKGKSTSPQMAKKICDTFDINMWDYFEPYEKSRGRSYEENIK